MTTTTLTITIIIITTITLCILELLLRYVGVGRFLRRRRSLYVDTLLCTVHNCSLNSNSNSNLIHPTAQLPRVVLLLLLLLEFEYLLADVDVDVDAAWRAASVLNRMKSGQQANH